MADFLPKTFALSWARQGNQVVSDCDKSPVCLNALPRTHEHMAKGQMLLDVLVKDLDPETLVVEPNSPRFAYAKVVGEQKTRLAPRVFGDQKQDRPDLWQMDDLFCNPEFPFLGKANSFVNSRSLGQVTDICFPAADLHDTVLFDCSNKSPTLFDDRNENRGARVPAVHENGDVGAYPASERKENFQCQLDLAFELAFGTRHLGPISKNGPTQPLCPRLQNTGDRALTFDNPRAGIVMTASFDFLSFSGANGIVDDHDNFLGAVGHQDDRFPHRFPKSNGLFDRTVEKTLQVVGKRFGKVSGNFSSRVELDQPDQPAQINQKMPDLGLVQNPQEFGKTRRNFLRELFSHGFRALLGLVSIGDFGRKPFYLKYLELFFTSKFAELE